MTAACGAAAAVIVCVAALAGAFSGPAGQQARPGHQSSPQPASASSKRPTSSVLGAATTHPVPGPSGSGQAASPAALCRQYMEFFTHPGSPANWSAENAVVRQLSGLAGGWGRIMGYCAGQFGAGTSWSKPDFHGGPGAPVPGSQPDRDGRGEPGLPGLSRAGPAHPCGARQAFANHAGQGWSDSAVTMAAHASSKVARCASLSRSKTSPRTVAT